MPNKKLNAKRLWIQFEDVLVPRLGLTVWDRAVYHYLLRHSLLIGKRRLRFAAMSVAHNLRLSNGPVRQAVRRLDELGALRFARTQQNRATSSKCACPNTLMRFTKTMARQLT